ncbi:MULTISPECIES: hypothetical protein [unclassified Duganella]|nr:MULTISPECIES: hypothetical protein [unclassified Duganella]
MRKLPLIAIIVLLALIAGYLALDRSEKNTAQERSKAFEKNFAK